MSRLTREGTAEPVSRHQILRRERGQGIINFSCSADHEQDWHPYPDDPYHCYMCDYTVRESWLEKGGPVNDTHSPTTSNIFWELGGCLECSLHSDLCIKI